MPMGKNSTLLKSDHKKQVECEARVKASTINFIKQFVRAYSYDKRLASCGLGGFMVN